MSKRPGGLTALAVLNFVFGGLGLLVSLVRFANMNRTLAEAGDQAPPGWALSLVIGLGVVSGALLLAAGFGYLGLKKTLGKRIGTAYAVVAIIGALAEMCFTSQESSIFTLFFLVYPIVTLFLIYTTFKDDFVR